MTCFACSNTPTTVCSNCGQFYCKEHGANDTLWTPEGWCSDCAVGQKAYSIIALVFVALLVMWAMMDVL